MQVLIACFDPCRGLRRDVQVELAGQAERAQYTQGVVAERRLGNRPEPPCRQVRGAAQGIDERPPPVQDVRQAEGHGVDGEVPLAQVRLERIALEGRDVDGEPAPQHDAAGPVRIVQRHEGTTQAVRQLPSERQSVRRERKIHVVNRAAQEGVPHGAAHQIDFVIHLPAQFGQVGGQSPMGL